MNTTDRFTRWLRDIEGWAGGLAELEPHGVANRSARPHGEPGA